MKESQKIGLVVVLAIVAIMYWYKKDTVKVPIVGASVSPEGALALVVKTPAAGDDSAGWVGKKVYIYTSSLGFIHSTVAAALSMADGSTHVVTADGAYKGTKTYVPDAKDAAHIVLKL